MVHNLSVVVLLEAYFQSCPPPDFFISWRHTFHPPAFYQPCGLKQTQIAHQYRLEIKKSTFSKSNRELHHCFLIDCSLLIAFLSFFHILDALACTHAPLTLGFIFLANQAIDIRLYIQIDHVLIVTLFLSDRSPWCYIEIHDYDEISHM
ncbi:hypothetical protein L6452_22043 [Arctium lappa]|uniref:Uncharacterized protein n=1 Tax=Arctium lappa TaxID=4217 RepID=A0ACB9AZZ9_ARCLA|nr:hypothetical protein L6452_22043 [Arctium lappa]